MDAYPVGEAAAKVGLTTHTLRWYELQGLLDPPARDSAGRRRYSTRDIDWLVLLTKLRRTGMPVRDMRRYAELARPGPATIPARRRLFEEHRDRVLGRIADLNADLDVLNHKIKLYAEMERDG